MTEILSATAARNFVGGAWSESASGATYEKHNPWRPSEVTGVFAASTAADARAAVDAAREAFPAWAALPAPARAAFFFKAADAIEARVEQIAQDMTAEMGKPLREARMESARAAAILRYSAGRGVPARGRGVRAVGRQPDALHAPPAARRRRPDHAVELPGRDPGLEARTGADLRQHRRPQARLRGAAHRAPHRRVLRRGGASRRGAQRAHRRGLEGGRRARLEPRRPRALVHRARFPSAAPCATRRRPATAACSSSSAATTRSS